MFPLPLLCFKGLGSRYLLFAKSICFAALRCLSSRRGAILLIKDQLGFFKPFRNPSSRILPAGPALGFWWLIFRCSTSAIRFNACFLSSRCIGWVQRLTPLSLASSSFISSACRFAQVSHDNYFHHWFIAPSARHIRAVTLLLTRDRFIDMPSFCVAQHSCLR